MNDVDRLILEAWEKLGPGIMADSDELNRRLARRRLGILTRPVRAWCLALRASDQRITAMDWILTPMHALDLNHPEHPYEPIEHEVTIQTHAIRRYCNPRSFSREDAEDVAKMLGASYRMIQDARKRGIFKERMLSHLGGKPGRPIPLLSNGGKLLDPSAMNYERPHPIWGGAWEFLNREIPSDFEQTVVRRPVFRLMRAKGLGAPLDYSNALTPALSRREREQRIPLTELLEDIDRVAQRTAIPVANEPEHRRPRRLTLCAGSKPARTPALQETSYVLSGVFGTPPALALR